MPVELAKERGVDELHAQLIICNNGLIENIDSLEKCAADKSDVGWRYEPACMGETACHFNANSFRREGFVAGGVVN